MGGRDADVDDAVGAGRNLDHDNPNRNGRRQGGQRCLIGGQPEASSRRRSDERLIQRYTIRIVLASQCLCSDQRFTPSDLGSVRRTLLGDSYELARSPKIRRTRSRSVNSTLPVMLQGPGTNAAAGKTGSAEGSLNDRRGRDGRDGRQWSSTSLSLWFRARSQRGTGPRFG